MQTLSLEAILPQERDPEPAGGFVDSRFRPSFVDIGHLQNVCCRMASDWKDQGLEEFPSRYLADVRIMIERYVRHVVKITISDRNVVTFLTKDKWSTFAYSFELNVNWL